MTCLAWVRHQVELSFPWGLFPCSCVVIWLTFHFPSRLLVRLFPLAHAQAFQPLGPAHAVPPTRNAFPPSHSHRYQSYCFPCSIQMLPPPGRLSSEELGSSRQEHRYSGIRRDRSLPAVASGPSCLGSVTHVERRSPLPRSTPECPLGGDRMTRSPRRCARQGRPTRSRVIRSFLQPVFLNICHVRDCRMTTKSLLSRSLCSCDRR